MTRPETSAIAEGRRYKRESIERSSQVGEILFDERRGVLAGLLDQVHPAIGFCEQALGLIAIFRTERGADTDIEQSLAANRQARIDHHALQRGDLSGNVLRLDTGHYQHKLIAAHTSRRNRIRGSIPSCRQKPA